MTPDILALSRAYMALPGAPVRDMIADELSAGNDPSGHPRLRDCAGVLWCPDTEGERPVPWLPDLTDAATGGVMLVALGADAAHVRRASSPGTSRGTRHWRADYPGLPSGGYCETLGEAVARFAVALGRAS